MAQSTIRVPADVATIQAGIDVARNGDIVLVSPGTYTENLNFNGKAINVTSGARAYTDAAVAATVLHDAGNGPNVLFHTGESRASILNGFTIENTLSTAVLFNNASGTLSNSIVQNNQGCSVVAEDTNASPLIQGNQFRRNGGNISCQVPLIASGTGGGSIGTSLFLGGFGDIDVLDNVFEENTGFNSNFILEGVSSSKVLIQNNIIRNNIGPPNAIVASNVGQLSLIQNLIVANDGSDGLGSEGIVSIGVPNFDPPISIVINDNTFADNVQGASTGRGVQLSFGGRFSQAVVENNLFISQRLGPVVRCLGASGALTFRRNDLRNIGASATATDCPLITSDNLSVDPQFLNPAAGDYHVQPTSPVVRAGDPNVPLLPSADLDNKARTVDGTIDLGAYEVRPHPPIVLRAAPNLVQGGNPVLFSAQLTGDSVVPTGVVSFLDGSVVFGTGVLDASAAASLSSAALTVGTHTITASYPGDFNFEDSVSNAVVEVVTGYATATSLRISPNPAFAFQSVALTATVSSPFGAPNGTVVFMSGGSTLGTATLNGAGVATLSTSSIGAGSYNVVAIYNPTTLFAGSSSSAVPLTIIGADSTTSLAASPNPAYFSEAVTYRVVVRAAQGSSVPTGTIIFSEGGVVLGSAPLGGDGAASFSTSSLGVGAHSITAAYGGSSNFNSSSASVNEVITAIATTVALTAAPNPAAVGQAVTLVAKPSTATASPALSGSVTFFDGSAILGTAPLNNSGQASLNITALTSGTHNLTASYAAGTGFTSSVSPAFSETILPFSFTVALSPSTITLHAGQQGTVGIQLSSIGLFAGPLTLSYGALPRYSSASLSSTSVALTAGGTANSVLTLGTFARTASLAQPLRRSGSSTLTPIFLAATILLLPFGAAKRRRRLQILGVVITGVLLQTLTGCTNTFYETNLLAAGTYQLAVTATDSSNRSNTSNLTIVIVP